MQWAQKNADQPTKKNTIVADRAADDVIWQNNFDEPADWTAAGPSGDFTVNGWSIGTTTTGWYFGEIDDMGTSGNFARFVNGDPSGMPAPIEDGPFTLTYNSGIDLTGVPAPHIEFEQYGARYHTLQAVEVSTDGGITWIEVGNNNDIVPLTPAGGAVYNQPETRRYNLSCVLEGDLSDVSIRLIWDGAINGDDLNYTEYGWFVDNIRIVEGHSFDTDVQAAYFRSGVGGFYETGLTYYSIPDVQYSAINFSALAKNHGTSTLENLYLHVRVVIDGTEVFTGTSDSIDLAPCGSDSLSLATQFFPLYIDTYEITWQFFADSADTYLENNIITDEFELTDYVWARDNGEMTSSIANLPSNLDQPFMVGNVFEASDTAHFCKVRVQLDDNPDNVGKLIYAQVNIWSEEENDFVYLLQTADHEITSGENGGTIQLRFEEELDISVGDLILVMVGHYMGNVGFGQAQEVETGTVFAYDASSARYEISNPRAIMVRPQFQNSHCFIGINEEKSTHFTVSQNTPNPFGTETQITYELKTDADVEIEITTVSGKTITTLNQGRQAPGNYTLNLNAMEFAQGIYFYTFTVNGEKITKRMVVTNP